MRVLKLLPLVGVLVLLGLGAGFLVAQAQESPEDAEDPQPKVLSWEPPVITGTVTRTTTFTATATVSPTVADSLECVVRPKKFEDDMVSCTLSAAGGTVTVTVRVTPTEDIHGRSFNFQVFLRADDEKWVVAPPLQVRLFTNSVPRAGTEERGKPDDDEDNVGPVQGTDHRSDDHPGKGDEHRANPGTPPSAGDHGRSGGQRGRR